MRKIAAAVRGHRKLAVVAGFCLFLLLSGAILRLSSRAGHQQTPIVLTQTKAIRVIGTEQVTVGGTSILVVKLQNVSDKPIKAVTIRAGNTWVTKNLMIGEDSIVAGSVVTQQISASLDTGRAFNTSGETATGQPTIAAVLFADGEGDGDPRYAKILTDQYRGVREFAKRAMPKLRMLSQAADKEKALDDLIAEESSQPVKGDVQFSQDYQDGMSNARTKLHMRLSEIKDQRRGNRFDEADKRLQKLERVFEGLASSPAY